MVKNKNYPKVYIIILNWNRKEEILECMHSLEHIYYPNYEIIVIDNASRDNSIEVIRKLFPKTHILENIKNMGYAGGNNIGIIAAMNSGADYIWLLNNDVVVSPDSLNEMVISGEKNERIGLLSPVIYDYNDQNKIQNCGAHIDWQNYKIISLQNMESLNNKTDILLWGTALLIKRIVIEKVGLLNERFFAYCEDYEFSLRCLKKNYVTKIVESAKVFHKLHLVSQKGIYGWPDYYWFYMSRNEYWFWYRNIPIYQKPHFIRRYFSYIIRKAKSLMNNTNSINSYACLEGFYSAIFNISGEWNKKTLAPNVINKSLLWHPYFFADLLDYNILNIVKNIFKVNNYSKNDQP